MPEAFHARLLFLTASPLVSSAFGQRRIGLWPTKLLVGREKKPLVPRVQNPGLFERFRVPLTAKGKREFVHVSKFSLYFSTPKLVAVRKFCSIIIVLDCFYLFIFYFEKF